MIFNRLGLELHALLDLFPFPEAVVGIRVEGIDGAVYVDWNGARRLVPASLQKLVTTAAGLQGLGLKTRFFTRIGSRGVIDANGRLQGNLEICGDGDADIFCDDSLGSDHFGQWAVELRRLGVREIGGELRDFSIARWPGFRCPDWQLEDLWFDYAAGASVLAVNSNALTLRLECDSNGKLVVLLPIPGNIRVQLHDLKLIGNDGPTVFSWRFGRGILAPVGVVRRDHLPMNCRLAVPNGTRWYLDRLRGSLGNAGIAVRANNRHDAPRIQQQPPNSRDWWIEHHSPCLEQLCRRINHFSDNFRANQLYRALGAHAAAGVSWADCGMSVMRILQSMPIPDIHKLSIRDGSGLSRMNLIQPLQVCALLNHCARDGTLCDAYLSSLPVAGRSGDLATRPILTGNQFWIRAKTGYIEHVRSLAGYIGHEYSPHLSFCVIINHYQGEWDAADPWIDELLRAIVGAYESSKFFQPTIYQFKERNNYDD